MIKIPKYYAKTDLNDMSQNDLGDFKERCLELLSEEDYTDCNGFSIKVERRYYDKESAEPNLVYYEMNSNATSLYEECQLLQKECKIRRKQWLDSPPTRRELGF